MCSWVNRTEDPPSLVHQRQPSPALSAILRKLLDMLGAFFLKPGCHPEVDVNFSIASFFPVCIFSWGHDLSTKQVETAVTHSVLPYYKGIVCMKAACWVCLVALCVIVLEEMSCAHRSNWIGSQHLCFICSNVSNQVDQGFLRCLAGVVSAYALCFVRLRCSLDRCICILVHPSGWSRIESRLIIHMSHTSHSATYFCCIFLDVGVIQHGWKQPDQHETFCSTAPRPAAIRQSRFWMPGCSLNLQGSPVLRWSTHKILQTKRLGKSQGSHVRELCQLCDVVISVRHYGFNLMHMQNKWRLESCDSAKSASTWTLQSLPKKRKGECQEEMEVM